MATQGLVTVKKDGAVALKIVVGDNGMNAQIVADAIRAQGRVPTLEEAYRLAGVAGFGCPTCRVVISSDSVLFKGPTVPKNLGLFIGTLSTSQSSTLGGIMAPPITSRLWSSRITNSRFSRLEIISRAGFSLISVLNASGWV